MTDRIKRQKSKLTVTMWMTLDGFVAGPNGELDWILGDEQMSDYEIGVVSNADTILFGRKTYQEFYDYWSEKGPPKKGWEKTFADKMNALNKIVVSKTIENAEWKDSTIISGLSAARMKALKTESKDGIVIYGSASIVQQLTNEGLIDEFQLLIHPIVLGDGKKLFKDVGKTGLDLVKSKAFKSGVMILTYRKPS
jgi:dihydrofolate reductase